jgi:hypothetical protein
MSSFWDSVDPNNQPASGNPGAADTDVAVGGLGQIGISQVRSRLSPQHPLFFFGAIAAATFGLIGVSTHVHVGPFKAGASVGNPSSKKGGAT